MAKQRYATKESSLFGKVEKVMLSVMWLILNSFILGSIFAFKLLNYKITKVWAFSLFDVLLIVLFTVLNIYHLIKLQGLLV